MLYRDKEGHEIDLIVQDGSALYPIEIKLSAKPNMDDILANVNALSNTGTKLSTGGVICLTGDELFIEARIWYHTRMPEEFETTYMTDPARTTAADFIR